MVSGRLSGQEKSGGRSTLCQVLTGFGNTESTGDFDKSYFKLVVEGRKKSDYSELKSD